MSFKFVEEALACRAARTRQDAFLAPKSRAAAVSKAMAGEFGDLAGREGGKRNAAGTGAAAAAAPEAALAGGGDKVERRLLRERKPWKVM